MSLHLFFSAGTFSPPPNTVDLANVVLLVGHRLRPWPNIIPALFHDLLPAGSRAGGPPVLFHLHASPDTTQNTDFR